MSAGERADDACASAGARNRAALERLYAPGGFGRGCLELIADGVRFRLIGDTRYSGTFRSKYAWAARVFLALPRELEGPIGLTAGHILVEGNHACVLARGSALARNGLRYDNDYCLVYRFAGGVIVEATEYLDTDLIDRVFGTVAANGMPAPADLAPLLRRPQVHPVRQARAVPQSEDPTVCANKALVTGLFDAPPGAWLDGFAACLADDAQCRVTGAAPFSGIHRGRAAIASGLLAPLGALLDGGLTLLADAVHGDGDWVWAQVRGLARTRRGDRYDGEYCLLFRLRDARIAEVVIHHDTALLRTVCAAGR